MKAIWVRNITTNNINEVSSLSFGSDNWEKAYALMIERGYKFQIGKQLGNNGNYYGLYLMNPLEIKIEPSEYDVVNRINEEVKRVQERNKEESSPVDLFERLEGTYKRAAAIPNSAIMMAPPEALDNVVEDQKQAYNKLIESLKTSSNEEKKYLLKRTVVSDDLKDNVKLGVIMEIMNLIDGLLPNEVVNNNQELLQLFKNLEGTYKRADSISNSAIMMAPPEALDNVVEDQKQAYNTFIELFKISSLEEIKSIIKKTFVSSNLKDNVKLAIISNGITLLEEKGEKSLNPESDYNIGVSSRR